MALTSDKADVAFADLVYADQELVDAEFAGIVAASFGWPPAPPPAAPGFPSPPGGRQRSPPGRARANRAATR